MSVRGCMKCGYVLTGLPAEGTVVTCPECAHRTDLAVPLPVRENDFAPLAWATVPMVPCATCVVVGLLGARFGSVAGILLVLGLLGGAITAGVLKYKGIGRQVEMGRAPMQRGEHCAISICFGLVSLVTNAVALAGIYVAVSLVKRL